MREYNSGGAKEYLSCLRQNERLAYSKTPFFSEIVGLNWSFCGLKVNLDVELVLFALSLTLSACAGLLSGIITKIWAVGRRMMSNVFGAVEWSRIEGGGAVWVDTFEMIECLAAKTSQINFRKIFIPLSQNDILTKFSKN